MAGVAVIVCRVDLQGLRCSAMPGAIQHSIPVARQFGSIGFHQLSGMSFGELAIALLVPSYEQSAVPIRAPAAARNAAFSPILSIESRQEPTIAERCVGCLARVAARDLGRM